MELLEEDLTCPICCCLFEDPRVLPCSHSFCRRCLVDALHDGGDGIRRRQPSPFRCPTCRKETARDSVASLQVNYALRSVVEKYSEIRALTPTAPDATAPTTSSAAPSCRAHRDQPLNIFCATDLRLICGFCATAREHRGHRLCALREAHELERAAFEKMMLTRAHEPRGAEAARARLDALESARRRALQEVSRDAERAADYLARAARALENKRAEISADFDGLKLAVMQRYDPEIARLRATLEERRRALRVAESLRTISEPLAFLTRMQEFREAMRAIDEEDENEDDSSAPLLSPAHADPLPTFDVTEWDNVRLGELHALRVPHELRSATALPASHGYLFFFCRALWRLVLLLLLLSLVFLCACACVPALRLVVPAADRLLCDASALMERGASLVTELMDTAADFIS
ncbi:tripartite motif-containing 13 isoform X2 [Hoplias malabaricus]